MVQGQDSCCAGSVDEEISRRLATEKRRTKRKTESAPASPGSDNATATTHKNKSAPS